MVTGKIKDIYFRSLHAGLGNPAIILIGEVVNLNRQLTGKLFPLFNVIPHAEG